MPSLLEEARRCRRRRARPATRPTTPRPVFDSKLSTCGKIESPSRAAAATIAARERMRGALLERRGEAEQLLVGDAGDARRGRSGAACPP